MRLLQSGIFYDKMYCTTILIHVLSILNYYSYNLTFQAEFKKLCRNLTSDQVEVAFNKFDLVGNGKLNYR